MGNRLEDKVAIVTGGATGIGEAISHKFAKEGASVMVCGLPEDPVQEVVSDIRGWGGEADGFQGDIATADKAENCIKETVSRFGKLNILVNNAGTFQTVAPTTEFPVEDFEYMTRMNIHSVFLMTRFALPHLQETGGVVLATGSEAGMLGQPNCTPYGGSKGWIHGFIRGVALEQVENGVRANCICPGPIDTQWHETADSPMTKQMEADILSGTPMGRRGTPEEAANVFLFLASDEASFVTGALYFVDGGISIGRGPLGERIPDALRRQPIGSLHLKHSKSGLKNKKINSKL
ncbi:MAG: SDR family oxidoreductase [Calditrichia bacterium]